MDAGIADTLNRGTARLIAERFDQIDASFGTPGLSAPWYRSHMARTLMEENSSTSGDRAWFTSQLAYATPGLRDFDGPADQDWDNLFSHLRAEILSRRDPQSPLAEAAKTQLGCVV